MVENNTNKVEEQADYRQWLAQELMRRVQKNPRYSLRAFAKSIHASPSFLSRVLNGKRALGIRAAETISTAMMLDPDAKRKFLNLVIDAKLKRAEESASRALQATSTLIS
jgi:uncharacterized protein (TIGR02147 family)